MFTTLLLATLAMSDLTVEIDGREHPLTLMLHSVRSESYRLLVADESGRLVEHQPSPARTVRGTLLGSTVAGSLKPDGLHGIVQWDGEWFTIEPEAGRHVARPAPSGPSGRCGVQGTRPFDGPPIAMANQAGPCIAELACDVDSAWFALFDNDIAATEASIDEIINAVNLQYDPQAGISHEIVHIVIRTEGVDPYAGITAPFDLLIEVNGEWANSPLSHDLAHLFTGQNLDGGTIGIAYMSAVCRPAFSSGLSMRISPPICMSTLVAHEMGHNWGAPHCDCPENTMNPILTCQPVFSEQSVNAIDTFLLSQTCLDCPCEADANGDGQIDIADLAAVILAWGECKAPCPPDFDNSGAVDVGDLAAVILQWGVCE